MLNQINASTDFLKKKMKDTPRIGMITGTGLGNLTDLMNIEFREVFILREYTGLSYKEIASLLEIDEDLVKSRLYKARQKLVNKISKLVD